MNHLKLTLFDVCRPDHVIQYLSAASLYGMSDLEEEYVQYSRFTMISVSN